MQPTPKIPSPGKRHYTLTGLRVRPLDAESRQRLAVRAARAETPEEMGWLVHVAGAATVLDAVVRVLPNEAERIVAAKIRTAPSEELPFELRDMMVDREPLLPIETVSVRPKR